MIRPHLCFMVSNNFFFQKYAYIGKGVDDILTSSVGKDVNIIS